MRNLWTCSFRLLRLSGSFFVLYTPKESLYTSYVRSCGCVENVCLFVFSLQAPINDNKACVSLMGIKSTTKKAHIVRAILESIAYRWASLFLNHTVNSTWLVGELLTWSVNTSKQHESLCLSDFGFVKLCWFIETKSMDAAQGNKKKKKKAI